MPALTVIKSLRNGALALALIGGAALLPQAASANSFQESGDFGGTWTLARATRRVGAISGIMAHRSMWRRLTPMSWIMPSPAYGPPAYYDYGPGIALGGPGIGFSIGID